jgi:AcrR family transcriptional regulator
MVASGKHAVLSAVAAVPAGDEPKDKRDRIIERAVIMFNEVGYDRVRVGDITDSLNMGKGTFYLYFRNKKELLLTCFEHVTEQIREFELLPKIREGDFFTRVGPRVEAVHTYEWWPGIINLLRAAELSPDVEVKTKAREAYEIITEPLRRDLEAAIQAGRARNVDAELAAYGFIGLGENLWFRSRLDDRYPPEQVVNFMVDAVTCWLASGASLEQGTPPGPDAPARVVSRDGTPFDLGGVRCNGQPQLKGFLGLAQIDVDLARVSNLVIVEPGEECLVDLVATDGTEVRLRVDGSSVLSGDASLGTVRIAMRDLASLTRG